MNAVIDRQRAGGGPECEQYPTTPDGGAAGRGWLRRRSADLLDFYATIDLRSLALMRIGLGVVLIANLLLRWTWLSAFYTDQGALPASLLPQVRLVPYFPSPLSWIEPWPWAVHLAFGGALVCFVAFTVGYRTRLFTVLSLVAFSAVAHRNPYLMIGADFVLGSLLLWSLTLPVGARFSLDAVRAAVREGIVLRTEQPRDDARWAEPVARAPQRSPRLWGAFGIVLQLALIYLATAIWKSGPMWGRDGTALYYALQLEQHLLPLGAWLRTAPLEVLRWLAWGALAIEFAAAPLILFPWGQPWLRRLLIVMLLALHLGIALTIDAGLFSFAMLAAAPLLLTTADWQSLARRSRRWSRPIAVYYDDDCGVCSKTVQVLAALDRFSRLSLIGSSDLPARRHEIPAGLTERTIVVFDAQGRMTTRIQGVATIAEALPWPWRPLRMLALPGLRSVGNFGYDMVARNRHRISGWLGLTACGVRRKSAPSVAIPQSSALPIPGAEVLPTDGLNDGPNATRRTSPEGDVAELRRASSSVLPLSRRRRLFDNVLGFVVLLSVLGGAWNLNFAPPGWEVPLGPLQWPTRAAMAYQRWIMFAPDVRAYDAWWVAAAVTVRGEQIDLFTEQPVSFEQPTWREHRYPHALHAWLQNAIAPGGPGVDDDKAPLRAWMLDYLAREYDRDRSPDDRVERVELWYVFRPTPAPEGDDMEKARLEATGRLSLGVADRRQSTYVAGPGHGTLTYRDREGRKRAEGTFSNSPDLARDGRWTFWNEAGEVAAVGPYRNGVRDGRWRIRTEEGHVAEGPFVDDRRHGVWTLYDAAGVQLGSGPWERGEQTGVWTTFYPTGARQEQAMLVDGVRQGAGVAWHPNGRVAARGAFRDGRRQGAWTFWHPNGVKQSQGAYVDDLQHGAWTSWHPDGSKESEGKFDRGTVVGAWTRWEPGVEK